MAEALANRGPPSGSRSSKRSRNTGQTWPRSWSTISTRASDHGRDPVELLRLHSIPPSGVHVGQHSNGCQGLFWRQTLILADQLEVAEIFHDDHEVGGPGLDLGKVDGRKAGACLRSQLVVEPHLGLVHAEVDALLAVGLERRRQLHDNRGGLAVGWVFVADLNPVDVAHDADALADLGRPQRCSRERSKGSLLTLAGLRSASRG